MKRILVSLAACAALVAAGGAASYLSFEAASEASTATVDLPVRPPANVAVETVTPVEFQDHLPLAGVVEAWHEVTLSAEVQGAIESQGVKEGDRVRAGQELIRIDTTALDAQRAKAIADATLADQELERIERLRAKDISSPQELDRVQANRKAAQAALRLSEIQLEKSVIAAPMDGIVDTLYKEEGEFVGSGAELVRVVQLDRVKVVCGVSQQDVSHFSVGDKAVFEADAFLGRPFPGTIHHIATSADPVTRTFTVELAVDNAEGLFRPGMVCRIVLTRNVYPDALVVPIFAVIVREGVSSVFVEEDGIAHRREVKTGVSRDGRILIVEGLAPNARVIVSGHRTLRDGQAVNVMTAPQ